MSVIHGSGLGANDRWLNKTLKVTRDLFKPPSTTQKQPIKNKNGLNELKPTMLPVA